MSPLHQTSKVYIKDCWISWQPHISHHTLGHLSSLYSRQALWVSASQLLLLHKSTLCLFSSALIGSTLSLTASDQKHSSLWSFLTESMYCNVVLFGQHSVVASHLHTHFSNCPIVPHPPSSCHVDSHLIPTAPQCPVSSPHPPVFSLLSPVFLGRLPVAYCSSHFSL